jgi:hypothetical protein
MNLNAELCSKKAEIRTIRPQKALKGLIFNFKKTKK